MEMFRGFLLKLLVGMTTTLGFLGGALPAFSMCTSVFLVQEGDPVPVQDEEEKEKETKGADWWNRRNHGAHSQYSSHDKALPLPHKPASCRAPILFTDSLHLSPCLLVPLRC